MSGTLQQIKARAEAATPGTWTTKKHGKKHGAFSDQCIVAAVARGQGIYTDTSKSTYPANDQEFIAHARQDVPRLCEALEREEYHRVAASNRITVLIKELDSQPYKVPKNVSVMIADAAADLRLLYEENEARIDQLLEGAE